LEAVHALDGAPLRGLPGEEASAAFRPKTLVALLTYCYAAGIYGSEEIEATMREDVLFRLLCANELPNGRELRLFRRSNREAIEACLRETLRSERRFAAGQRQVAPGNGPALRGGGTEGRAADGADAAIASEVTSRLELASWLDNMTLDD
jgi:hypothetical protein